MLRYVSSLLSLALCHMTRELISRSTHIDPHSRDMEAGNNVIRSTAHVKVAEIFRINIQSQNKTELGGSMRNVEIRKATVQLLHFYPYGKMLCMAPVAKLAHNSKVIGLIPRQNAKTMYQEI